MTASNSTGSNVAEDFAWVPFDLLEAFMVDVFKGIGVPEAEARICAGRAHRRRQTGHRLSRSGAAQAHLLRPHRQRQALRTP